MQRHTRSSVANHTIEVSASPNETRAKKTKRNTRTKSTKAMATKAMIESSNEDNMDLAEDYEVEPELSGIVKVFATCSAPDFWQPWQNKSSLEATGSGFVIEGNHILTNAHVVADAKFVMVRKFGQAERFEARVVVAGHDCDLAVLAVDDQRFFKNMEPLKLGEIPMLEDEVTVVGFPMAGDNISFTRGIVSRIELQRYEHAQTQLLAVQIDAAINSGNSGGPALQDGKVVGVAFQSFAGHAENIGFVIPTPVIQHFLVDVERVKRGYKYSGFCASGIHIQTMENAELRAFKKMGKRTGVLAAKVQKVSAAKDLILAGDVILSLDGNVIANDGSIDFRRGGRDRISCEYVISMKHDGEKLAVLLLRDGKEIHVDIILRPPSFLVPSTQHDITPSFYIFAGLLFVPLTKSYLREWGPGEDWFDTCPKKLLNHALFTSLEKPGQQLVVLSQVLAHSITIGYTDLSNQILAKVNGISVDNLAHLFQIVSSCSEGPIVFELEDTRFIVMDAKKAKAVTHEILKMNRIPMEKHFEDDK